VRFNGRRRRLLPLLLPLPEHSRSGAGEACRGGLRRDVAARAALLPEEVVDQEVGRLLLGVGLWCVSWVCPCSCSSF
jgi:hypothetical protein